ncbi:hypothetical protein [Sulfobacillus harzensis]|uniref:hypothetical protein n=1 Tax=Sulfobacillus harzensis TaxID=2729629 RepID=UPI001FAB65D0|nr:hypothetical protein [Sulfobacillus harzensis]
MNIGKVSLTAAAALGMAAVIAGCGSGSTTSNASGSTTAQPLVMAPAPYGSYTANFNPFSSSANPGTDGFIYEPLFYFSTISNH